MTSTQNQPGFLLTPHQQRLLFEALNANKPTSSPTNNPLQRPLSSFDVSPAEGKQGVNEFNDSPLLDYDYDISAADSSFDFSFDDTSNPRMIGELPGAAPTTRSDSAETDGQDKRSHPDDEDDEENGAKRRESEDKVAKKPGRKPLTTEPSSKRKAQNRAAQRAFRERKEKHLKDLETKVEELLKASEATNHENSVLREKVEKMTVELAEYKKRLSSVTNGRSMGQSTSRPSGPPLMNNINDVNFQFEFPKFGVLPGPANGANGAMKGTTSPVSSAPNALHRNNSSHASPQDSQSPGNLSNYSQTALDKQSREDMASLSAGIFNPPTNSSVGNLSRSSFDSHFGVGGATASSSPSASSNSNMGGASSSCGTSPEPFTQSPMGFKPVDTLTTIGEEQPAVHTSNQGFEQFANIDFNEFNWLPQNDFQFAPQLFNDYREPVDNLFSNVDLDDGFFKDAFDIDFATPYNLPMTYPAPPKKKDLVAEIDAAKNADALDSDGQLLTCTKIWEQLQNCPKVQSGDFDLDGLCSDLQKKAKCSGSGAVVNEHDFKSAVKKYLEKNGCDSNASPGDAENGKESVSNQA